MEEVESNVSVCDDGFVGVDNAESEEDDDGDDKGDREGVNEIEGEGVGVGEADDESEATAPTEADFDERGVTECRKRPRKWCAGMHRSLWSKEREVSYTSEGLPMGRE